MVMSEPYRVRRNWELWEASGLLSVMAVFVAVLGGGMLALMLLGLLRWRVALRAVSSCWRAACACCRSSWSCICSCCSCEAEGPEELSCPPAERRTPDSWESNSGEVDTVRKRKSVWEDIQNRTCITRMKVRKPIKWRPVLHTCYGVHGFPIAWRVGGALWRGEPTSWAAGKVHVSPACPRTAQSTPRVEHPTNVPYAAALIVHTLVKEQLLRMCHNTHITLNHLTWFQVWVW